MQISSNGIGGGNYADPATWAGGVVPQILNGDTSYIVAGDTVNEIPSGEYCDQLDGNLGINYGTIYYVNTSGTITGNGMGGYVITHDGYMYMNDVSAIIDTVNGWVDSNWGTIYDIQYGGTLTENNSFVGYISGTVNSNYSEVYQTNSGGVINTNQSTGTCLNAPNGICLDNYGYCNNVAGNVGTNYSGGIIDNGDNTGSWGGYYGIVNTNQVGGIIRINGGNNSGGNQSIVGDNYGEITENYGIVNANKTWTTSGGIIYLNGYNGVTPSAWVEINEQYAVVHRNQFGSTVNYNYGEVHNQDGYVTYPQSGSYNYFSSMDALSITDPNSGAIYGIAPDSFSDPLVSNVALAVTYQFDEETLTGTRKIGGGINGSGILGMI